MRRGWREVWFGMGAVLLGTVALAAPPDPKPGPTEPPVRLTVEIAWGLPSLPDLPLPPLPEAPGVELEVAPGRVLEVVAWPEAPATGPAPQAEGAVWRLGPSRGGRVRARIEAPLGASLLIRTGGPVIPIPLMGLLDGPQQTGPQAPVQVQVQRLSWDPLEVRLGGGDGIAAPGEVVPVTVAFNLLTPEPGEVELQYTAELKPIRGEGTLWRVDQAERVATNLSQAPSRVLAVPMPRLEGTYRLEVRSMWRPVAGSDGSRLGRWWRWRRQGEASAERRVSLAVVDPAGSPPMTPGVPEPGVVVDTIDLSRSRGHRPSASGRAPASPSGWEVPEAALTDPPRRDRLRGWIGRGGGEGALLAPADSTGIAWSAVGLKVPHPGRPHRLSLTITGGDPQALGVALLASGGPETRPRVLLDVRPAGPPAPMAGGGAGVTYSWLVWPDVADPVLLLANRGQDGPVSLATVELTEIPQPPPLPIPADADRKLGLRLTDPGALDRFGGATDGGPDDALGQARHLADYLAYCGAGLVVLPDGLSDRSGRTALEGQAGEDCLGPDRLDLILRALGERGQSAWLEVPCDGPLPGLPAPDSVEALTRGLVRVNRLGRAEGPEYQPLHPEVRAALRQRVASAIAPRRKFPALAGLLIRLGHGPTLPGGPDTGLDDATFARFIAAMFDRDTARRVPGLGSTAPGRFAERHQFLTGPGRLPWLTWRAQEIGALYDDLSRAVGQEAPGATLAVVTPGLDDGPAGRETRRGDLAGHSPQLAWRAVGLDLDAWPASETAPLVLRGADLNVNDLACDLATSPELDAQVAAQPRRGLLLGLNQDLSRPGPDPDSGSGLAPTGPGPRPWLSAPAQVGNEDELLGHALSALDARWVVLSDSAVLGQEERLRRFARVFLPLPAQESSPDAIRKPFGVTARTWSAGPRSWLALVNDMPYPVLVESVVATSPTATVDDLGRGLRLNAATVPGGKRFVLELAPFGVATLRIEGPGVRLAAITEYPHQATLADLKARADELSVRLTRLARREGIGGSSPPASGFEPAADGVRPAAIPARPERLPDGWSLVGDSAQVSAQIDPVRPRSGRGSLHLEARGLPASVACDPFEPPPGTGFRVLAWLRADRPESSVRLWIEGEAAGQPVARRSELAVGPDWTPVTVRVEGLPTGGLDRVRLRFELLAPGNLWVDDLAVTGPRLSESERFNVSRTLGAALQAYRERRYADFARLADSRWARRADPTPNATPPRGPDGMVRGGDATDLPPGRRLR